MKPRYIDYTALTAAAAKLGFVPYTNRFGTACGLYTMQGLQAPVDLSASATDELSILRNAVKQLSEDADESYNAGIEKDLMS